MIYTESMYNTRTKWLDVPRGEHALRADNVWCMDEIGRQTVAAVGWYDVHNVGTAPSFVDLAKDVHTQIGLVALP